MLTQERVRELFDYFDGGLYWKARAGSRGRKGARFGAVNKSGYRFGGVDGGHYSEHHLVLLLLGGMLPEAGLDVDHVDREPSNNSISNLKEVSRSENMRNRRKFSCNRSGVTGVSVNKRGFYTAQIMHNKKAIYIGISRCKEEAALMRLAAEQCLGLI